SGGNGEAGWMTWTPEPWMAKAIVSFPAVWFASLIARRSEPEPPSFVFLTVKTVPARAVPPPSTTATATARAAAARRKVPLDIAASPSCRSAQDASTSRRLDSRRLDDPVEREARTPVRRLDRPRVGALEERQARLLGGHEHRPEVPDALAGREPCRGGRDLGGAHRRQEALDQEQRHGDAAPLAATYPGFEAVSVRVPFFEAGTVTTTAPFASVVLAPPGRPAIFAP